MEKIWYLKNINFLKSMTSEEMMDLSVKAEMKEYKRNSTIYLSGAAGETVFLLKSGVVSLNKESEDGRSLTIALVKMGEIFGELEVIEGISRQTSAIAHKDTVICILTRLEFLQLLESKPNLSLELTKLVSLRRRKIENKLKNVLFKSVSERILILLSDLVNDFGISTPLGTKINVPFTHQNLANLVGASRQTVSEVLADLKKRGIFVLQGKYIIIPDIDLLSDS